MNPNDVFTPAEINHIYQIKKDVNDTFMSTVPAMFNKKYMAGHIVVSGQQFAKQLRSQVLGEQFATDTFLVYMLDHTNRSIWNDMMISFPNPSNPKPAGNWEEFAENASKIGMQIAFRDTVTLGPEIPSFLKLGLYQKAGMKFKEMVFFQTTYKTLDELLVAPYMAVDSHRPVYMTKGNFYASRDSFDRAMNTAN